MKNFAVMASGRGGNLKAIIEAVQNGAIQAHLKLVISDKKEAYALEHAKSAHIPALFIDPKAYPDRTAFDQAVLESLHQHKIDFVVLAGFMRLLSAHFIRQYPDKILNIHPSLLPSFKGTHAIRDAFEAGAKVTGPTVHFVVEEVDAGPIILQETVPVAPTDSLASLEEKIHQAEHRIYPRAIELYAQGRLKIEGGKVILL